MNSTRTQHQAYPLRQLYVYLTHGCNLRCRHCWINPQFQSGLSSEGSLPVELFRSIIEQAGPLGLARVKLTGGEPLLHPQISELLEHIRCTDVELTVETNAVLCTPALARKIAACKKAFVSVSLDGADAATHEWVRGVTGCFAQALQGIGALVQAGIRPQVIMSVMRCNRGQLEQLVRLAESLGAASVKFNPVQPTARAEQLHQRGEALSIGELAALGAWVENTLSQRTSLRLFYDHPAAFRPLSKILGPEAEGCSRCGIREILGVLADGSYALCGIGEIMPELVFGTAAADRLEEVWTGAPVLQELRRGLPGKLEGICGECLMQEHCSGGCIAQNYYRTGSLWAPFWYCRAAQQAGLFPESRRRPARSAALEPKKAASMR